MGRPRDEPPVISVAEAHAAIQALLLPVGIETVPLADAAGRVLADEVASSRAQPPFNASAMDGYAVASADAHPGARLTVVGATAAGEAEAPPLGPGEARRIFTGAPVPAGADRVVIQEDVTAEGDTITLGARLDAGPYVRPMGDDFAAGTPVTAPRRLTPEHLALLAAMNIATLPVRRRPDVALIATGDELVWPGEAPGPAQIVASNIFGLKALLEAEGARCRILPIARDRSESLAATFALAAGADLIVTIGGASVGEHDLVSRVAGEAGLALSFYKVAMRPGKPLMAGRMGGAAMVGLPGNPVSAMVCGHVFLRPAIRRLLGLPGDPLAETTARLTQPLSANGPRMHYMRARITETDAGPEITVFPRQDSGLLSVLAGANALAIRPPKDGALPAGHPIRAIRLP